MLANVVVGDDDALSINSLQNGGAPHSASTACLWVNPVRSTLSTSNIRSPGQRIFMKTKA